MSHAAKQNQTRPYFDGEYPHELYDRRAAYDSYGGRYGAYPYPSYGLARPFEDYDPRTMTPATVRRPILTYNEFYQNTERFRTDRQRTQDGEANMSRLHQLERQAWAQAQIIREQSSMLEAMSRDPRIGRGYAFFPRPARRPMYEPRAKLNAPRQPAAKKKEARGKADPRLTEKRAQAKQFKTFIRTHFTVRAAFRFVEHFLSGEEEEKFNADTRPYLVQFSEELKRPKSALPIEKKTTSPGGTPQNKEGMKEFFDIATRHLRTVVEGIKNHPRYQKNVAENKDHEKSIEASMSDNQEGRICLSRLMIYAITAFGIQGKTRLHQIANLLQEMEINLEQDPDLVTAIMAEAESRAKNYQQFCHASSPKDKANSPPMVPVPSVTPPPAPAAPATAATPSAPCSLSPTSEQEKEKEKEKEANNTTVEQLANEVKKVVIHAEGEVSNPESAKA